jgi:hypothetical protein
MKSQSPKFHITNSIPAHPKMQSKILIKIKDRIRPENPSENLANVCAPSHRERPSKLSAIQSVNPRSRCSHPRQKLQEFLRRFHTTNLLHPILKIAVIPTAKSFHPISWHDY